MKRMHLFEFEDLPWFPNGLRVLMTRYINTIHRILKSSDQIADCLADFLTTQMNVVFLTFAQAAVVLCRRLKLL